MSHSSTKTDLSPPFLHDGSNTSSCFTDIFTEIQFRIIHRDEAKAHESLFLNLLFHSWDEKQELSNVGQVRSHKARSPSPEEPGRPAFLLLFGLRLQHLHHSGLQIIHLFQVLQLIHTGHSLMFFFLRASSVLRGCLSYCITSRRMSLSSSSVWGSRSI